LDNIKLKVNELTIENCKKELEYLRQKKDEILKIYPELANKSIFKR